MTECGKSIPKYFINSLDTLVREGLIGLALANPNVQVAENVDAIIRKDVKQLREKGCVLVVSGGGAGHEPMFAGFVGPHMLTAAISGQYFASPSAGQITKLVGEIATVDTPVLLVLANYTGDRLNFGLAREELTLKGFKDVRLVVFGDDLSPYLTGTEAKDVQRKRRGLAGLGFVHRIAGVLSEQGKSLDEIEHCLGQLSKLIYTISISLSACDIPGHGASFELPADAMELGLGVHGESGIERISLRSARETIDLMLTKLLDFLNAQQLLSRHNHRLALIVNNLGGLTQIEMNLVMKEVLQQFQAKGVIVERFFSGYIMTSGNMKGVSLSVLLLDDDLLNLLDQSQEGQAPSGRVNEDYIYRDGQSNLNLESGTELEQTLPSSFSCPSQLYTAILSNACKQIIKHEAHLNELDSGVGDSDCGSTLSTMAKLFLDQIQSSQPGQPPSLATLAKLVNGIIGGTSGALYSLLLTTASNYIRSQPAFSRPDLSICQRVDLWLGLVRHCNARISLYSGAQLNNRTMLDALHGIEIGLARAVERSADEIQDVCRELVDCTWTQARKTASMQAAVGRAAYVNQSYLTKPDAGAVGVAIWLESVAKTLCDQQ